MCCVQVQDFASPITSLSSSDLPQLEVSAEKSEKKVTLCLCSGVFARLCVFDKNIVRTLFYRRASFDVIINSGL